MWITSAECSPGNDRGDLKQANGELHRQLHELAAELDEAQHVNQQSDDHR